MTEREQKKYAQKHGREIRPDERITAELKSRAAGSKLPCAVAFDIARNLLVPAADVGKTADLLSVELVKCQLGLFGYTPKKKVEVLAQLDPGLEKAILAEQQDGRLSCEKAWAISLRLGIPKLAVGSACETLKIKIKPCQLGAF